MSTPDVSVIIVARAGRNRDAEVARALEDCAAQSHGRCTPIVVNLAPGGDLAAAYNRGLDGVTALLCCVWDARDRQHPDRVRVQYQHLAAGCGGAALTGRIYHVRPAAALYWVDYRDGPAGGVRGMVADSLLFWATACRLAPRTVDPPTALFQLVARGGDVAPVPDRGDLTIRVVTTLGVLRGRARPAAWLAARRAMLGPALAAYDLAADVVGGDGIVAFRCDARIALMVTEV